MRLALIVEYDGAGYHGFQLQPNAPTVQGALEEAIHKLTGERVRVKAAGRTDAGVHAVGQVVTFDTSSTLPPNTVVDALNHHLPADVAVREAHPVGPDFDPRRRALVRTYRYTVLNDRVRSPLLRRCACLLGHHLDVDRMRDAAALLVGEHDFARFSGPLADGRASTVRRVYDAEVRRECRLITFDVSANAFLPHQVRRMAGALVEVGRGKLPLEGFAKLLDGKRGCGGAPSLPPHGLCLMRVEYADFPPPAEPAQASGPRARLRN
jgi:tRNA pseudouridine38-40 synthase